MVFIPSTVQAGLPGARAARRSGAVNGRSRPEGTPARFRAQPLTARTACYLRQFTGNPASAFSKSA
jgi:hypothetical protein